MSITLKNLRVNFCMPVESTQIHAAFDKDNLIKEE